MSGVDLIPAKVPLLAWLKTADILVHAALWLDSCGICSVSSSYLAACPYNQRSHSHLSNPSTHQLHLLDTLGTYLVCLNLKFLPPQCPQAGQKRLLSLSLGFSSPFFAQLLDYYGERYVKKQIILPNISRPQVTMHTKTSSDLKYRPWLRVRFQRGCYPKHQLSWRVNWRISFNAWFIRWGCWTCDFGESRSARDPKDATKKVLGAFGASKRDLLI